MLNVSNEISVFICIFQVLHTVNAIFTIWASLCSVSVGVGRVTLLLGFINLIKFSFSKSSDSSKAKKKEAAKMKQVEGESDSEFGFNHTQSKPPKPVSSKYVKF